MQVCRDCLDYLAHSLFLSLFVAFPSFPLPSPHFFPAIVYHTVFFFPFFRVSKCFCLIYLCVTLFQSAQFISPRPFCSYLSSFRCLFPPAQLLQYTVFLFCPEFLCSDVIFSCHGQITSLLPLPISCSSSFPYVSPSFMFLLPVHPEGPLCSSRSVSANDLQPPALYFSLFIFFHSVLSPFLALFFSFPFCAFCLCLFPGFLLDGDVPHSPGRGEGWGQRPPGWPHISWVQDEGVKELSEKEIKGCYCLTWCGSCVPPSPAAPQRCLHLKELRSLSSPLHPGAQECTPCWPSLIGKWKPLEGHLLPSCKSACGLKGYFMRCLCILDPLYFFPAVKPEAVLHSFCSKPGLWDPESQGHHRLWVLAFIEVAGAFIRELLCSPCLPSPEHCCWVLKVQLGHWWGWSGKALSLCPLHCSGTASLWGFLSAASRGGQLFQTLCPLSGPQPRWSSLRWSHQQKLKK